MLSHGVAIPIIMYFMNLFMCVMFPFPKCYTKPLGLHIPARSEQSWWRSVLAASVSGLSEDV